MAKIRQTTMPSVGIRVELFGSARLITGKQHIHISVPCKTTISHIVSVLSKMCPELIGDIIREDKKHLQPSYTFNLNGTSFLDKDDLELREGDTLLTFSSQAGG